MAIYSGLFNSVNGDRKYNDWWFAKYFSTFIGNGVFPNPSTNLQVVENENMTITVKPGPGWIYGYFIYNDNDYVLQLDVADGVLKRIDRIALRLDYVNREIVPVVKKGTFASSPVAPALQRDSDAYELALADVYVGNGVLLISQANITDQRLNSELCGIVKGTVDQIDTSTVFNQYYEWFLQTKDSNVVDLEEFKTQQEADFNAWFETVKGKLAGDVATNLANDIMALEGEVFEVKIVPTPLVQGSQVVNAVRKSPYQLVRAEGKTIVNLIPPFKYWTKHANASGNDYLLTLNATGSYQQSSVVVPVVPGQSYFITAELSSGAMIEIQKSDTYEIIKQVYSSEGGSFVVPIGITSVKVVFLNNNTTGTFTFINPILVEGSVPQNFVRGIQGIKGLAITNETNGTYIYYGGDPFHEGDVVEGKKVTRARREVVLDGALNWTAKDRTGFKLLTTKDITDTNDFATSFAQIVKYDGKLLTKGNHNEQADGFANWDTENEVYISISDTDSGWGESYNPTPQEIVACLLGWKMYNASTDGTGETPYTSGTKAWCHINYRHGKGYTNSLSTNTLPITMVDNKYAGGTNYPPFTPYKLVYQLATPVVETIRTEGEVILEEGDNNVTLVQGVVFREKANPTVRSTNGYYVINNQFSSTSANFLKHKAKKILNVYKNKGVDEKWEIANGIIGDSNVNGEAVATLPPSDFDSTATYYVTYEILPELTATIDSVQGEVYGSIKSLLDKHTEQIGDMRLELDAMPSEYVKKAQEDWIPVMLQNGWTGNFKVKKNDLGQIYYSFSLGTGVVAHRTVITNIQEEFIPSNDIIVPVLKGNVSPYDAALGIAIQRNGEVRLLDPLASALPANNSSAGVRGSYIYSQDI